jgi:hypothetical protein
MLILRAYILKNQQLKLHYLNTTFQVVCLEYKKASRIYERLLLEYNES